jgi:hypothetical protein
MRHREAWSGLAIGVAVVLANAAVAVWIVPPRTDVPLWPAYAFTAISVVGLVCAIALLTHAWPFNRPDRLPADDPRRAFVKERLGQFAEEGMEFEDDAAVARWAEDLIQFVRDALGTGEAALIDNHAGFVFYGGSSAVNQAKGRVRRLVELLVRIDQVALRDDYELPDL